jgi:oligogalacturonide transport system substrate-binding protein
LKPKSFIGKDKKYYLMLHDTGSFAGEVLMGMSRQMTGKYTLDDNDNLNYGKREFMRMFTWLSDAVKAGVFEPVGEAALYNMKGEQNPKWINQQLICLVDWASNYQRYLLKNSQFVLQLPPTFRGAKSGASNMRPSQEICLNTSSPNIEEAPGF